MKKFLFLVAFAALITSCTRIDSGSEALKVDQYGNDKGTPVAVPVKGMVFYNIWTQDVYEYPTYMQHVEYKEVHFTTKDGSLFTAKPNFNYSMKIGRVVNVFTKYRKQIGDIEDTYMASAVQDAYVRVGNNYTADSLMANRARFEDEMMKELTLKIGEDFNISQLVSNMVPPEGLINAINEKNRLVQEGLAEQNKVVKAAAAADVKIENARGDAEALKMNADAQAYANSKRSATLNALLIQQQWIEAWKAGGSQVPGTILGGNSPYILNLK